MLERRNDRKYGPRGEDHDLFDGLIAELGHLTEILQLFLAENAHLEAW
jgi:hypothetical protein